MEIMSLILEIVIALEVLTFIMFFLTKRKRQPKNDNLEATEKMVKTILLNNKWDDINEVIGSLEKDSIHINYKLRKEL